VIFGPYEFLGTDLYGKTLGIFGMGRIGNAVAKRASGFEMKILYHNRSRLPVSEERKLGAKYVSLDELFRKSDVISIHSPYTPHNGSSTVETRKEMAEITVRNLVLALSGKKPIYQVRVQLNH